MINNNSNKLSVARPANSANPSITLRQWAVTSVIAAIVAVADIVIIYIGIVNHDNDILYWSIASEGMITFFGMLIVSSYHARYKPSSKGIMRRAIAASLISMYVILLALTISGKFTSNADQITQVIVEEFSIIIMIIIGFYFGSKGMIEILDFWKNKK